VQNLPKPVPDWVKTQILVEEEEERTEEKRRARADEAVESIHTFWGQADFLLPRDLLRRVLADPHSSGPYVIASTGKPTTQLGNHTTATQLPLNIGVALHLPDGESEAGCSVWSHGYNIKLLVCANRCHTGFTFNEERGPNHGPLSARVQGAPWYIRSGISVINRLAGYLPSLIPSLPDIGKKDHLDMRTVFGVWVKGPEGPALLSHLLAHVHNTLIKVRATLEIRLRSSPSRAR